MLRRNRPSLLGSMARTAVIAGTATHVSGKVAQGQAQQAAAAQQQADAAAAAEQARIEAAASAAVAAQQAVAPPAAAGSDFMAQLQQLAELRTAGLLTDEEFAAAKAKLLG